MILQSRRIALGAGLIASLAPTIGSAQHVHDEASPPEGEARWHFGASAIPLVTTVSPAYGGRTLTEGYLSQPMLMITVGEHGAPLSLHSMVDFEGLTLERGELNPGISGEGYVDRRHPHTYLHELVLAATRSLGTAHASIAIGKGFVAFGTQDPMMRPLVKYPVNHHLAQILERALVTAALRYGPSLLEFSSFNGDEPTAPSDWPETKRFFDSWSARGTVFPLSGIEVQASMARVKSPEIARGGGLDQRKMSASFKYSDSVAVRRYLLIEVAKSAEYSGDTRAFDFTSFLAEGQLARGPLAFAARFERTERPEEERLANVFRTARPAQDFNILGKTRWTVATASVSRSVRVSGAQFAPFVEIARATPKAQLHPTVFEPRAFYGSRSLWSYSVGARLSVGAVHMSSGEYGAATRHAPSHGGMEGMN